MSETSAQVDMSLHLDTLSWFCTNQSLILLNKAACLIAEKQKNTNFKDSGYIPPWFNRTQGKHAITPLMRFKNNMSTVYKPNLYNIISL